MNECDDPDFDPYLAALDEEYFKSYTGCKDPECEVHGTPPPRKSTSTPTTTTTDPAPLDSRKPPSVTAQLRL